MVEEPLVEDLKFNIGDNPVLSEIVQTVLFKFGYKWESTTDHPNSVQFTQNPTLVTMNDVIYHQGRRSTVGAQFKANKGREFDLTEIKEILSCNN